MTMKHKVIMAIKSSPWIFQKMFFKRFKIIFHVVAKIEIEYTVNTCTVTYLNAK